MKIFRPFPALSSAMMAQESFTISICLKVGVSRLATGVGELEELPRVASALLLDEHPMIPGGSGSMACPRGGPAGYWPHAASTCPRRAPVLNEMMAGGCCLGRVDTHFY